MNSRAKWRVIAGDIRAMIASGELAPGDAVPSEDVLADRYGVARMTARNALQNLEQAGEVVPAPPGGSRAVARRELLTVSLTRAAEQVSPGEWPTRGADAFLGEAAAAGRAPDQNILVTVTNSTAQVASLLGLHPGALVVGRQLVRTAGGARHNMITWWFPYDVADGTPLMDPRSIEEGSLAWLAAKYGKLTHTPATIWPRPPTPEEAQALSIPPGVSVAEVWRTSLMTGGLPVVTSMSLWPGDRAVLRIDL